VFPITTNMLRKHQNQNIGLVLKAHVPLDDAFTASFAKRKITWQKPKWLCSRYNLLCGVLAKSPDLRWKGNTKVKKH